jgi:pilus assembly protein CpaC
MNEAMQTACRILLGAMSIYASIYASIHASAHASALTAWDSPSMPMVTRVASRSNEAGAKKTNAQVNAEANAASVAPNPRNANLSLPTDPSASFAAPVFPGAANTQRASWVPSPQASADAPAPFYGERITPATPRPQTRRAPVPYAPISRPSSEAAIAEIDMFVGESRVFQTPNVGRVAVGNGALLTAAALDEKEVILFANAPGTSSLFVWNSDGRYQRVKVNIAAGDTSRNAREIGAFLAGIPRARIAIIGDKVIVEGDDLSDLDLARIDQLATRYPQIVNFTERLGWEQMVLMDVKVVEFPVSALKELGLKWGAAGGVAVGGIWAPIRRGDDVATTMGVRTGQDNAAPIVGATSDKLALPSALNIRSVLNLGLNATLSALAQEGKTVVLAEPQLSARNGSRANFLAGGEFPYTVSTINGPTVLFKQYGVKLDIVPRVGRNGVIRATIETEFSQIDASISTTSGPALLTRKTSTEFNVKAGETIVLSGLVQREQSTNIDKVPGLGDLPLLGALFRSKRFQNKETELVVFVTPTIVDAQTPGMVDRVRKTEDRLEHRLAPSPGLSDPLQPDADRAHPELGPDRAFSDRDSARMHGDPVHLNADPAWRDRDPGFPNVDAAHSKANRAPVDADQSRPRWAE